MELDQIHGNLLAFARKGTRDEHYAPYNATPRTNSKKDRMGYGHPGKLEKYRDKTGPARGRVVKDLRNLQFTLFD